MLIAAAANVQFTMDELVATFEGQTGIQCETIINSSGKITAQVMAGAPYDVFISADLKYPNTLKEKELTAKGPDVYAEGKLVLWSVDTSLVPQVDILVNTSIQKIAMASPRTAPYGKAAEECLTHYNILEGVTSKLVYGESISQTNQFILSGAAPVGFTALSVVRSPNLEGQGSWVLIPEEAYSPIEQGMVILTSSSKKEEAEAFYDFMLSDEAQSILRKYGYGIPETAGQ
ncbi:MAG: molybdate ABC transporter substrate-binding protein [Bacteroidota bacterium]